MRSVRIPAARVHATLSRKMLAEGYDLVLDLEKSEGVRLRDARKGRTFLDFFSFFASSPVGINHPGLHEKAFERELLAAARHKPSNSDVYTAGMARFVEVFSRVAIPKEFPHLFVVEGGALGVENALKAAFDWKVRKNLARGKGEKGSQIVHFRQAFHGRSGYTLSLTNTADPRKTQYFPKFPWPRIENPKLSFPVTPEVLKSVIAAEARAAGQIKEAFAKNPDDIAAIIIEPIQAEGGDNHFRPEFLATLRVLADENEAMLVFDEVQTGIGITGKMWAYRHFGVTPDLICFGKKVQMGGFLAGKRIDEVADNVFRMKSRINSTWGGNLADMVRAARLFEIIRDEKLVENAAATGRHLLARIDGLCHEFPDAAGNPRGRGLMCAFDLADGTAREAVRAAAYRHGLLILPCGERSLRFRPPLTIRPAEIDEGMEILRTAVRAARPKKAGR